VDHRLALVYHPGMAAFDSVLNTWWSPWRLVVATPGAGGWRYSDAAVSDRPAGVLAPEFEGAPALVLHGPRSFVTRIPHATAQHSACVTRGDLRLTEDGSLEGRLTSRLSGHFGADWRREVRERGDAAARERAARWIRERLTTAEIDSLEVSIPLDVAAPCSWSCRITVPEFARVAGPRMILAPQLFAGSPVPGIDATNRDHPIVAPFAYSRVDSVAIRLPPRWQAVSALPEPAEVGAAGWLRASYRVELASDTQTLLAVRRVEIGAGPSKTLPVAVYPELREAAARMAAFDAAPVAVAPDAAAPEP
jgi:hypothetical protein